MTRQECDAIRDPRVNVHHSTWAGTEIWLTPEPKTPDALIAMKAWIFRTVVNETGQFQWEVLDAYGNTPWERVDLA